MAAHYEYDAWGNVVSVKDNNGNVIASTSSFATINPIRYRGYYYDTETGFYYLKSRYYDPANCRFVSADTQIDLAHGTTNLNLFSYCGNDPVNRVDPNGKFSFTIAVMVALLSIPIIDLGADIIGTASCLAGSSFLRSKGYDLAASMYEHAFSGGGKDLDKDTVPSMLEEKLKSANELNSALIKEMNSNKDSFDTGDRSVELKKDKDLYYAAQHVNYRAWGRKENGRWKIDIIVWDTYDFGEYRLIKEGFSFANIANDLGTTLENMGQMEPYDWWIRYEYLY